MAVDVEYYVVKVGFSCALLMVFNSRSNVDSVEVEVVVKRTPQKSKKEWSNIFYDFL